MSTTVQRPVKRCEQKAVAWPTHLVPVIAAFLAVFGYVAFRLEPAVEYHHRGPYLVFTPELYGRTLTHPGGLAELVALLVSQLNYSSAIGALAFTSLCVVNWLLAFSVLKRLAGVASHVEAFVPVFLLLVLRNKVSVPLAAIGLMIGLVAAAGVLRWGTHLSVGRFSVLTSTVLLVLGLAGLGSALLFCGIMFVFEGWVHRRWLHAAGPFGALFLAFVLGYALGETFGPATKELKGHLPLVIAVFLSVPAVAAVLRALNRRRPEAASGHHSAQKTDRKRQHQPKASWYRGGVAWHALQWSIVVGGCAAVWATLDVEAKASADIDYRSSRGDFAKVVELAKRKIGLDLPSQIRLHRALYHEGRLAEDLFACPNQLAIEPLPGVSGGVRSFRAQTRTLLELGLVSDAEHLAHEALEMEGERPDILQELAEINVLKGRPAAARVFLNVLGKTPFHAQRAESFLAQLDKSPSLDADVAMNRIRSLMVTNDLPHEGMPMEALLGHHLRFNPRNKMAFEYLMTHYLLTLDLRKAVDRMRQADLFGYEHLPRHFEEAALLHEKLSGSTVELSRPIRSQTVQRFKQFGEAMERRLYATAEGKEEMSRSFGDTYWFYYYATQSYLKTLERGKS